jgi:hypothetical protein
MIHRGLVCLLLGTFAWGQAANSTPAATPQNPASAAPATISEAKAPEATPVPPDAPVITIQGMCDDPSAEKANSSDCKTVITRAEFEKLLDAVAPTMPPYARRQLATRYASMLAMAHKAHEMGLDQGPKFEERMKAQRTSVLAELLDRDMQDKASQVPDADIEDYYRKHIDVYQEADLQRLYIPHSKLLEPSKVKLSDAETKKRQQDSDEVMKKEAEALRARAAAGDDFDKLQAEAFTAAGQKGKAPSTKMNKVRRTGLPPDQASVMDLKPNEVSPLLSSPTGYFVYKIEDKDTIPLEKAHDEIVATLRSQRLQESRQALQQSSTATLDDKYFGTSSAAPGMTMPPRMNMPRGDAKPPATPPSLGPK